MKIKPILYWGQAKLLPLVIGLKKLQIRCLLDNSKIALTCLEEKIAEVDGVQSVEIIAIVSNKYKIFQLSFGF